MAQQTTLSLSSLLESLRDKHTKIPYEIGAFVLLEACEQVLGRPTKINLDTIQLTGDGGVQVEVGRSITVDASARSVCETLATVLVTAGPGVPPVLVDLVEHGPSTGDWQLTRLRDELEAALLPLNRSAARRVLSRMIREALGEFTRRRRPDEALPAGQLDSALDGLLDELGIPPEAPARPVTAPPVVGAEHEAPTRVVNAVTEDAIASVVASPPEVSAADASPVPAQAAREPENGAQPNTEPSRVRDIDQELQMFEAQANRRSGSGPIWALLFFAMAVASVGAFAFLRPDLWQQALGVTPEQDPSPPAVVEPETPDRGNLQVDVDVAEAQVFLFVGRGPAVAEGLHSGVPHEFLAIADGRDPGRALVTADADWRLQDGTHWHELAIQLSETVPVRRPRAAGGRSGLGESLLVAASRAGDTPAPSGGRVRGNVRIITNPAAAKVYALVGFSHGVEVKNLPVEEPTEILVWKEGYAMQRLPVLPSDWQESGGKFEAAIHVTLEARGRR